jgi:putative acetyltransferase
VLDPTIRDYRSGDDAGIRRVIAGSLATYGLVLELDTTDRDLEDITACYIAAGGSFRVLEHADTLVGTCGLHNESQGIAELRKMYLDPRYKGRGLGRRLLDDAIENARRLGFRTIILESNSRLIEAAALYRKRGFVDAARDHLASRCDYALKLDL